MLTWQGGGLEKIAAGLFAPWVIPALSGGLFALLILGLHVLTAGRFPEIDYFAHTFFCLQPFNRLMHMDALLVLGSSYVFWGMELLLLLKFFPGIPPGKNRLRIGANLLRFAGAGSFVYFLHLLFCCWVLAFYEGYVACIFSNLLLTHGPWHFISHLREVTMMAFYTISGSLTLSVLSLLVRWNAPALMLSILNGIAFMAFVQFQVGLID